MGASRHVRTARLGRAAGAAAALALALPAAAGAGVVDATVRCAGAVHAGLPVFALDGEPSGPPPAPGTSFPPGFRPAPSLSLTTGDRFTLLALSTFAAGYRLDGQRCVRTGARLALPPRGVALASSIRLGDAAAVAWRCVGVTAVLVRLRLTSDARGIPLRALLVVLRAKPRRPLLYVEWSRTRVREYTAPTCG